MHSPVLAAMLKFERVGGTKRVRTVGVMAVADARRTAPRKRVRRQRELAKAKPGSVEKRAQGDGLVADMSGLGHALAQGSCGAKLGHFGGSCLSVACADNTRAIRGQRCETASGRSLVIG